MISCKVYIRWFWFELDNGNFKDFFPYQLVGFTTKTDARRPLAEHDLEIQIHNIV